MEMEQKNDLLFYLGCKIKYYMHNKLEIHIDYQQYYY